MKFLRNHRVVIAYVILTIGVAVALVRSQQANDKTARNAKAAYIENCEGRSDDRQRIVKFVDTLDADSRRSAEAALKSPSASPQQKAAAKRNLAAILAADKALSEEFAPIDCTYPSRS